MHASFHGPPKHLGSAEPKDMEKKHRKAEVAEVDTSTAEEEENLTQKMEISKNHYTNFLGCFCHKNWFELLPVKNE